ncbi:cytosine permease [Sutcliffiella halmapala]|uniref:cytosine permease n=1 Tax=Sutcliffiella halmapala TaxID=79882 RepID=UPI001F1DBF7D|nr:cytosine permease [Sutcliffiella halmapala]
MGEKSISLNNETVYKPDILPTSPSERTWKFGHFFSVWMGSVHNIPSYVTIGGFFAIGLSIWQVFSIITISSIILSCMLILNGHAGSKYGIPFSILLRKSYGRKGAILPGILRGVIAAIMWFGLQTYAGSIALTILIGKFWPDYLLLGGTWTFLGLSLPSLLSFLLFWLLNVLFIFGGIKTIGALSKAITPLIFLVFGGMSWWAINLAGGISPILNYTAKGIEGNTFFVFIVCISVILSTWVAPILSVSDITRFSRSNREQSIGQIFGLLSTYLLFSLASITIIIGSEIAFGTPIWNVLDVVEKFDDKFAIALALFTVCLSTLSVNIVGNIIPAGYQLSSLFPTKLTFRTSAFIATICGILIMPWKLMEDSTSIFTFLNLIGGLLSPVIGVMLTNYYIICKRKINVDSLYYSEGADSINAVSAPAIYATLIAGVLCLSGAFIDALHPLYSISWFSGIIIASICYLLLFFVYESKEKKIDRKEIA